MTNSVSTSLGLPSAAARSGAVTMMGPTRPLLASVCCDSTLRYSHSLLLASSSAPGAACRSWIGEVHREGLR